MRDPNEAAESLYVQAKLAEYVAPISHDLIVAVMARAYIQGRSDRLDEELAKEPKP